MTTTVLVDFNDLARGGKVVALRSWADGPVNVGDRVTALDDMEDLSFSAVVAEENAETGEIYLALDADTQQLPTHLIFKLDDSAPNRWQTIPHSKYGAPEVLQAVWERYKINLDVQEPRSIDASPLVQHVQKRMKQGFWLRYELDAAAHWREQVANRFMATTSHEHVGPKQLRQWGVAEDGMPLVIACLENDSIRSVLSQMTDTESVVVTTSLPDPNGDWMISAVSGLSGALASDTHRPLETLSDAGLTVESTIRDLMVASGVYEKLKRRLQSESTQADHDASDSKETIFGDRAFNTHGLSLAG